MKHNDDELSSVLLCVDCEVREGEMLSLSVEKENHVTSVCTVKKDMPVRIAIVMVVMFVLLNCCLCRYSILDILTIRNTSNIEIHRQLSGLTSSESRVILLYAGQEDSRSIFKIASSLGLTTASYMWIVTQSTVGTQLDRVASNEFHPGILGIYLNTTYTRLLDEIEKAVHIFGHGLDSFVNSLQEKAPVVQRNKRIDLPWNRISSRDRKFNSKAATETVQGLPWNASNTSLVPNINCNSSTRWYEGGLLFR